MRLYRAGITEDGVAQGGGSSIVLAYIMGCNIDAYPWLSPQGGTDGLVWPCIGSFCSYAQKEKVFQFSKRNLLPLDSFSLFLQTYDSYNPALLDV